MPPQWSGDCAKSSWNEWASKSKSRKRFTAEHAESAETRMSWESLLSSRVPTEGSCILNRWA